MSDTKSRFRVLTDRPAGRQWETIEDLLPRSIGRRELSCRNNRLVEHISSRSRYRPGILWRDLPHDEFGPWPTVWKQCPRSSAGGTWDTLLTFLLTVVSGGRRRRKMDWDVFVAASLTRAYQHATTTDP